MSFGFNEVELRKFDLNLLLIFATVVRMGSLRGAAQRLYLGPSAVSMALNRLREALGRELFVRGRRGLEPTPFGLAFYDSVASALDTIGGALSTARAFEPSTAQRVFNLAVSDDLEIVLAPLLLERLRRDAPGIALVTRMTDFKSVTRLLDEGLADLAISAEPASIEARHRIEPLYTERLVAAWDKAKLDLPDPLTLEAYLGAPHALVSAAGGLKGLIDACLAQQGLARQVIVTVERFSSLVFLLKSSALIAAIPLIAAKRFVELGLSWRALPFKGPTFTVAGIWHARVDRDPAHLWFRALVLDTVKSVSPTGSGTSPRYAVA
jgi:LysR family transcriptional activator of mexEF-oprN operon